MTATSGIDRRSTVPYYSQLKNLLLADIQSRGLAEGDKLPGDFELCEEYDVSRTVVRQAMKDLEYEGLIRRVKGRGTFLAENPSSNMFGQALVGTFEDIQSKSGAQHSVVRRAELVRATAEVAKDLSVSPGELVVEIERLRLVDAVPWALTVTQLPRVVGEGLLHTDLTDVSLFGVLEQKFGIRFDHAHRLIEAGIATQEVAHALGLGTGAPVMTMRSLSFDATDRPLERFTGHHRGDLSRLSVDIRRRQDI